MPRMDRERAQYILCFYAHLMTPNEKRASRHLEATSKAMKGRTDAIAQSELRSSSRKLRTFLSDDPEVLRLTGGGWEPFAAQTAERIFTEHKSEIAFNCCPRCGALAKTPKARQCRRCRFDWHGQKS